LYLLYRICPETGLIIAAIFSRKPTPPEAIDTLYRFLLSSGENPERLSIQMYGETFDLQHGEDEVWLIEPTGSVTHLP